MNSWLSAALCTSRETEEYNRYIHNFHKYEQLNLVIPEWLQSQWKRQTEQYFKPLFFCKARSSYATGKQTSCICHQLWIRPRSLHQNVPSSTQMALQLAWGSPAWSLLLKDSFFLTLEISDPLKQKSLNPVPPGSACRYSAAGHSQATAGAWPSPCRERDEKTSATSPEVELKLIEELTQTTRW